MRLIFSLFAILATTPIWAQISLQAYRDSVYNASTEVMNSALEVEKAESMVEKERTNFLPALSADASFSTVFRREGDSKLWGFSLNPQLSQTIYAGGGVRAAWRQAQSIYQSTTHDAQAIWLAMRYEADFAYWQVSAMQL